MFFSLLVYRSFSERQPEYSLIPPLESTDIGEIGNWTIRGTASNLKNRVRLTSAVAGSFGSICQRVPTLFKEWSAEIEIQAGNEIDEQPGHGIWFFYTQEVCPQFTLDFNGFAFWVNTTSTNSEGFSDIYFAKSNGTQILLENLRPVGKARVRDSRRPLRLQISRRFDRLTVDATNDTILERVVDEDVSGTPDYGYFTLSASTTARVDNNDIISMRVFSMSPVDHPNKTFDFSTANRKYIEKDKKQRRDRKKRRHAQMANMVKYVKESQDSNKVLNAKSESDLKDAIRVIDEAHKRSKHTVTAYQLERFIAEGVDAAVTQALGKIELAHQRFSDTRQDIDELWSSLKIDLLELAIEEKRALEKIQEEVTAFAKQMNITSINTKDVRSGLKQEASNLSDNTSTNVLLVISFIEVTLYVVFVLYQRQKTDNFKKRD